MTGRNVNVYLQEKTYSKLRQATSERQISRFVNEAIEEKLARKKAEMEKEIQKTVKEITQRKGSLERESNISLTFDEKALKKYINFVISETRKGEKTKNEL